MIVERKDLGKCDFMFKLSLTYLSLGMLEDIAWDLVSETNKNNELMLKEHELEHVFNTAKKYVMCL